jgi:dTDP-4-amino-4,6-dideoxygalactose transaminase
MNTDKVFFGRPMIAEQDIAAVAEALRRPQLTNGPLVREFEESIQDYAEGGAAIAVSSCMAALHLTCMAQIKPGDHVIVPALTHPATAHAVEYAGGVAVFADVSPKTGNITVETIQAAMTDKTTAIMVVHYLGRLAEMRYIMGFARQHNLTVIEDCALALGARKDGVHAGLAGDAGCFSFYPVKHITTGEGGMILTKDPVLADLMRKKRSFGGGEDIGLNYRMSEIHAALGIAQMRNVEIFRRRRERNWKSLAQQLSDFDFIRSRDKNGAYSAYYAFSVFVPESHDRDAVRKAMSGRVETSVYYQPIVPLHPYYRVRGETAEMYPHAHRIATRTICLSCGPHLGRAEIDKEADVFRKATT